MKTFLIVTPPFDVLEIVTDEGQGPTYEESDVIEIECETKRDAIALGVKAMLSAGRAYTYCREQQADGCSPYTGVTAIDYDDFPEVDDLDSLEAR